MTAFDGLETGEHSQTRRLPTPRRSDENDEFTVRDVEFEVVDSERIGTRVPVRNTGVVNGGHYFGSFGVIWRSMIRCN